MRALKHVLAVIGSAALLGAMPAAAQQPSYQPAAPAPPRPGTTEPPGIPLPVVGVMLEHEQELGLSASQVDGLERLGLDVLREMIRRQADLMVAQVDLSALLDRGPDDATDVAAAEAKIRQAEQIRTDFQIAVLRAAEAAKSQLTPEQRTKLAAVLAGEGSGQGDPPGAGENPGGARGAGSPGGAGGHPSGGHPSGGHPSGGHPSGGRPPAGPAPGGRHFEGGRHFDHGRGFAGVGPLWWGPPYPYWDYPYWDYPWGAYAPPPVVEPPEYIQRPPAAYWYYCPSARAYYPSVPTCPEPWVLVAPTG
jgi:Spy/CpxP family protein refolding chaperone